MLTHDFRNLPIDVRCAAVDPVQIGPAPQPGQLTLGQLTRGGDATLTQRVAIIGTFEMLPSLPVPEKTVDDANKQAMTMGFSGPPLAFCESMYDFGSQ